MVIQSSSQGEWSWEGASRQEEDAWTTFVEESSSAASSAIAGLTGKIQIMPGLALSISLLSSSLANNDPGEEAAVDVSAPTLAPSSVARIKNALLDRSNEWADDAIESLFFFDLVTTVQTLLADLPDLIEQPGSIGMQHASDLTSESTQKTGKKATSIELSRALFWSHHLKAPSKLKDFNSWCPELRVWGIVRVGYPGYLCFEGESSAVDEIVRRVKALQWHALQLRVQHSWSWHSKSAEVESEVGPLEQALLSCALARRHPDNTHKGTEKVRTGCEVIDALGDLVERLRECGLPEDEISEALGIKLSGSQ